MPCPDYALGRIRESCRSNEILRRIVGYNDAQRQKSRNRRHRVRNSPLARGRGTTTAARSGSYREGFFPIARGTAYICQLADSGPSSYSLSPSPNAVHQERPQSRLVPLVPGLKVLEGMLHGGRGQWGHDLRIEQGLSQDFVQWTVQPFST